MQMRGASTQRRREPSDPIIGFERERNNPGIPALKLKLKFEKSEDRGQLCGCERVILIERWHKKR